MEPRLVNRHPGSLGIFWSQEAPGMKRIEHLTSWLDSRWNRIFRHFSLPAHFIRTVIDALCLLEG